MDDALAPDRAVDQARAEFNSAAARLRAAQVTAAAAKRSGTWYAPIDDEGNHIVTVDGELIGYLRHPTDQSFLEGWTIDAVSEIQPTLGPYRTPRLAMAALRAVWAKAAGRPLG